ncbi:MAG: S8 family peptidase [Sphingobacteriales bacterium JAD_PAG50586_3]|nr:MAG: S8 family peptidase [Sphingobacteriales bacterium JAD_PAG50586_3]
MGIIGAVRNNGIGIAGIAGGDATNSDFGIKKFSMKITGGGNNTTQLLCNSIYESVSGVDFSMNILNLSLSTSEYNQLLWEMYRYSSQMGVVMVSSSGNYPANANSVNAILYPACVKKDWNICVGASGINGELKVNGNGNSLDNLDNQYQSIHGGDFVDVIAPGTNAMVKTVNGLVPTSFVSFTGTSAAAPHVSAVAGLVLSYWNQPQPDNSNLAPEDVSYLITRTATDKIPAGQPDNSTGWGLLNGGNIFTTYSQPEYSIYHNSVPTSRTVTMYHANTGIFIPDQNYPDVDNLAYIGDVYEVTETVDHNFPLNYEIVDYWIRNSGQSMGVQLSLINGFYTLTSAETDIVFDSFDQNTAVTKSYVCFLKDKWPNIPYNVWFPYNPNNGNAQTHNYSVLLKDLAVSTNEQISGNGDAKLFPNPATDNVTIELSNNKSTSVEIKVTDISGRTLIDKKYSLSLGTNRINLDVSSLANSVYFVNLQTNAKNENIKFVKSK